MLKTIEGFAVECSVNKVYTSEALAYVVDEALQVFGGNGYSREFPAERAYRDARITRIYEGTNEINRLLIPTRLFKAGILQAASPTAAAGTGALAAERTVLGKLKALALAMLKDVSAAYGDTVKDEQEVLGHIADVVIECYAVESALARSEKLQAGRNVDLAAAALDVARVYTSDAIDRAAHASRQVSRALEGSGRRPAFADLLAAVSSYAGVDTVAARRRIAAAVIAAGRHPF